jgi:thiol-disulfide isomerase/thioredoxin
MRRLLALLAAVVVACATLTACTGSQAVDQNASSGFVFTSGTGLGKVVPKAKRKAAGAFSGTLLNGGRTSLAAAKGKIVVVNFWATWCAPCRTETPQFDLLYRKLKTKGVNFLGVDTKDERSNAQSFVKDNQISYPSLFDEQGETALRLGNIPQASLPFTVLIDRQGKVAGVYVERLSTVDLQHSLNTLLAGR